MRARGSYKPVRILIINPNTTASMTRTIGSAARKAAALGTEIIAMNPLSGPASIQGPEDGDAALPGLFALFDAEIIQKRGYDAAIIACFDDTGLVELEVRSPVPVTGIGKAAYVRAAALGSPFSVVTTLAVSIPVLAENIRAYGLDGHCAAVRASNVPVLDLEAKPVEATQKIEAEIIAALREDQCRSIVLGCAGMADLAAALEKEHRIPVIEGISAAVQWCEAEHAKVQSGQVLL
jgi:allantoin racemase